MNYNAPCGGGRGKLLVDPVLLARSAVGLEDSALAPTAFAFGAGSMAAALALPRLLHARAAGSCPLASRRRRAEVKHLFLIEDVSIGKSAHRPCWVSLPSIGARPFFSGFSRFFLSIVFVRRISVSKQKLKDCHFPILRIKTAAG